MKHLHSYNQFNSVNEGWKENLVMAFTLLANVAFSNPKVDNQKEITKIEQTFNKDKEFFSACLQLSQDMTDSDLSFDQRKGLAEAKLYFQSMRDGIRHEKLSDEGVAAVKTIQTLLMKMSNTQIQQLAKIGSTAVVNVEIVGK